MTQETTTKHPFWQGQDARELGADRDANPHPSDTRRHDAWNHGWTVADERMEDADG